MCVFSFFSKRHCTIIRTCLTFFYAVIFNSLLARTLRGHFRERSIFSFFHYTCFYPVDGSALKNADYRFPRVQTFVMMVEVRHRRGRRVPRLKVALACLKKEKERRCGRRNSGNGRRHALVLEFSNKFSRFDSCRRIMTISYIIYIFKFLIALSSPVISIILFPLVSTYI